MPRARKRISASRSSNQAVAIEPCSSSSALGPLDASSASAKIASESTVMSGSARSKPWPLKISSSLAMMPLWTPTTAPWRIGWLLALSAGVALRVVADVDERLAGLPRHREPVEERARAGALLVDAIGSPGPRYAYPAASEPRSAIAARSVCVARVCSTRDPTLRLYPAIPHNARSPILGGSSDDP